MPNEKINIEGKLTIEAVLNAARSEISNIEVGQVYETLRSIYPDDSIPSYIKNIELNDVRMTLPLASSLKAKREYYNSNNILKEIFKDMRRGDYLVVEEVNEDGTFICKNVSLNEEKADEFYKDPILKKIKLNKDDITFGNIKRIYRGLKAINL